MVKLEHVTGASFSVFYYLFWLAGLIYTGYNIRNNIGSFLRQDRIPFPSIYRYFIVIRKILGRYSSTISQKESRKLEDEKVQFPTVLICSGHLSVVFQSAISLYHSCYETSPKIQFIPMILFSVYFQKST